MGLCAAVRHVRRCLVYRAFPARPFGSRLLGGCRGGRRYRYVLGLPKLADDVVIVPIEILAEEELNHLVGVLAVVKRLNERLDDRSGPVERLCIAPRL